MAWVLDLDGVMRLGPDPIPGSADAVAALLAAGEDVVFVTNAAGTPIAAQEAALAAFGIDAVGRVIGAAPAAATLLSPSDRVFVVGEAGLLEAVEARGCTIVDDDSADVVVCGISRHFSYDLLDRSSRLIRNGARWIATNLDLTYPTPTGLAPGAGSIVAAITAASGVQPELGGKPDGAIVGVVRDRLGPDGIVVGDRADTDGAFARALGYRFGLVFTGVLGPEDLPVDPMPDVTAVDLATLVSDALAPVGGD